MRFSLFYILLMAKSTILVGGQAVIEGVMMRVPGSYATAVRRKDGSITIDRSEHTPFTQRHPWGKWPLVRGVIALFESMRLGMRTLQWSADLAMQDLEEHPDDYKESKIATFLTTIFALLLGVALFMVAPLWITTRVLSIEEQMLAFNLVAGGFRILFFLLYLIIIAQMKDVKRLFEYHGAEHKVVFNFESGLDVTWDNTQHFTTYHPRCGTSFLFVVLITAILLYAVLDTVLFAATGTITLGLRIGAHLAFLPLVAGVGYEFIKLTSANMDRMLFRLLAQPGLWLQRITTTEPDESQVEVSITALKSAFGERYDEYAGREYVAEAVA